MSGTFLEDDVPSFGRHIRRTPSLPEGIDEGKDFSPHAVTPTRRTSSMEDIARFHRYFKQVQTNSRMLFTWTHYLDILLDDLCSYETFTITSRAGLLFPLHTTSRSDISLYDTSEKSFIDHRPNKFDLETEVEKFSIGDTNTVESWSEEEVPSIPSERIPISNKSKSHLLMKICKETKLYARKTYEIMNIFARLSEECIECGAPLKTLDHKRRCRRSTEKIGDSGLYRERHKSRSKISVPDLNWQDQVRDLGGPVSSSLLSVTSSKGDGRSTTKMGQKCSPPKNPPLKRLAQLYSHYVKRG